MDPAVSGEQRIQGRPGFSGVKLFRPSAARPAATPYPASVNWTSAGRDGPPGRPQPSLQTLFQRSSQDGDARPPGIPRLSRLAIDPMAPPHCTSSYVRHDTSYAFGKGNDS